ncbi:hypothetical protein S40288_10266 [Stachybotrys chartarum IBT 40288]|nr:hypothetical protein S40288_10266 [Stachybotrys chartarum IBT 40288]
MEMNVELHENGLDRDLDDAMPVESNDGSYDEHYLDVDEVAAENSASVHAGESKIIHGSGATEEFIARTTAADFDATQALDMLQHRYTIDYGQRSAGSKPASTADEYYPTFHLDMISVVGKPLHAITNQSSFFDNVTFTLQHWAAPYSSMHAISSLPFTLLNRTFRLATGASREIWFIVMHPIQQEPSELPGSHAGRRVGSRADGRRSGLRKDHAEALSSYIKDIFLDGALLGEGIEPCWTLGERRSQNITFEKWSMFQELFMERWHIFVDIHAHDQFWADHQPAFHAYDHGANIPIQVNEALEALPRETTLRTDEYGSESESESEASCRSEAVGDDDDDEDEDEGGDDSPYDDVEEALLSVHGREEIAEECGSDEESSLVSGRQPSRERSRPEADVEGAQRELFSERLEVLRQELEGKYRLDGILQVSYAIAADINCLDGSSRGDAQGDKEALCLLADKSRVAAAYGSTRETTFYPLAFHPRPAYIRAKNDRLLRELRGERTPGQPQMSTPYARERMRVEAAIEQEQMAFRIEQVVTVKTARLVTRQRNFFTVLRPIFQIMRFFLKEPDKFVAILRRFKPSIFPGILCGFARLFEVAMGEMDRRFRLKGAEGLDLATCESIAVLDRLGNYCFTGDPRVLPKTVLGPLVTMESLSKGSWPFISPTMLDFREMGGRMDLTRWPCMRGGQKRPILMHVAALGYHYGGVVAANRHSQIWFSQLGGQGIRDLRVAVRFLEDVFREMWIPQTVAFLGFHLRQILNHGARSGKPIDTQQAERVSALLEAWEEDSEPFSLRQYNKLFGDGTRSILGSVKTSSKAQHDFAREILRACSDPNTSAGQAITSKHGTWLVTMRNAIRHTKQSEISKDDWVSALVTAMASAGIAWAPGSHSGRITGKRVVQFASMAKTTQLIVAPPGSLKRLALEADVRMKTEEQQAKRMRRHVIDFGSQQPFRTIPKLILDGFNEHYKTYDREGSREVANHYQTAHNCLLALIGKGDWRCDLMLTLVLTIAASSATPRVMTRSLQFEVAERKKESDRLAAALVTRMLWFLQPDAFSSRVDSRILPQAEMTKKMEKYFTNNRMLQLLGWIDVKSNRVSLRSSDCSLRSDEKLQQLWVRLKGLRKHPDEFIATVFQSADRVWVERCQSIIKNKD